MPTTKTVFQTSIFQSSQVQDHHVISFLNVEILYIQFCYFQDDIATNEEKADKDFVCKSEEEQCINTSHVYQVPNLLLGKRHFVSGN